MGLKARRLNERSGRKKHGRSNEGAREHCPVLNGIGQSINVKVMRIFEVVG